MRPRGGGHMQNRSYNGSIMVQESVHNAPGCGPFLTWPWVKILSKLLMNLLQIYTPDTYIYTSDYILYVQFKYLCFYIR
jgi:hypothetical protein